MWDVKWTKKASKYLKRLPSNVQEKVLDVVDNLAEDPYKIPHVKPMTGGEEDTYRIRIGPLRLLYRLENAQLIIIIFDLGPRGDISSRM